MPRDGRKAHNQALFRSVNERITDLVAKFGEHADAGPVSFICECPQIDCRAFVRAPLEVYDQVREEPGRYLVVKGHEEGCEAVVADLGGYLIVATGGQEPSPQRRTHAAA